MVWSPENCVGRNMSRAETVPLVAARAATRRLQIPERIHEARRSSRRLAMARRRSRVAPRRNAPAGIEQTRRVREGRETPRASLGI